METVLKGLIFHRFQTALRRTLGSLGSGHDRLSLRQADGKGVPTLPRAPLLQHKWQQLRWAITGWFAGTRQSKEDAARTLGGGNPPTVTNPKA
jgi:hypothetical protein